MLELTRKKCLLAALAVATGGCSTGMKVAPSDPSQRTHRAARECTNSILLPALDTLSAGVGAYNVGVSLAADDKVSYYGAEVDKGVGLALGITQLVAFGAAATYGYIQFARCQNLRAELNIDKPREPTAPAPATAPPAAGAQQATTPPRPEMAPGTADDHDGAASAQGSAQSGAATPDELPSWSAFRRVPLPAPAPASGAPYDGPVR